MYALFFQLYQVVFTSDVHRNRPDTVLLRSFVMEIEGRLTVRHMWSGLIPNLQPLRRCFIQPKHVSAVREVVVH